GGRGGPIGCGGGIGPRERPVEADERQPGRRFGRSPAEATRRAEIADRRRPAVASCGSLRTSRPALAPNVASPQRSFQQNLPAADLCCDEATWRHTQGPRQPGPLEDRPAAP